jgi:hypothetical protein
VKNPVLNWWRVENWDTDPPKFVELAVDGSVLFVREGVVQTGKRPTVARRELGTSDEAEKALQTELGKLRRKKFSEERRFEAEAPTEAEVAFKPSSLTTLRWSEDEAAAKRKLLFERLAQVGIEPTRPFIRQANGGDRTGSDGLDALDRDADARAATCLRIAREVLGVSMGLTWQQGHDGYTLAEIFPSAEAVFQRARKTKK